MRIVVVLPPIAAQLNIHSVNSNKLSNQTEDIQFID